MSKHEALVGEPIEEERPLEPKRAIVLPEWLRIKDDHLHPGDIDWFLLEADFNIADMPDAVDEHICTMSGLEKLFALVFTDLQDPNNPSGPSTKRKCRKMVQLHKGSLLSREECVLRMVPYLTEQRELKLGLKRPAPAPNPPPIDTSTHYCLFY